MKYPRTPHLPWSKGGTDDDIVLADVDHLSKLTLVYTEKLDGENTVMSRDYIHARSEENFTRPWQHWPKALWGNIRYQIPDGYEIFGECLYAVHSIEYENLPDYFFVFNMAYKGVFLPWPLVKVMAGDLGLKTVPELEIGPLREMPIPSESAFGSTCEGYVVRFIGGFTAERFDKYVAKVVRQHHVQTTEHWTKNWHKANLHTR